MGISKPIRVFESPHYVFGNLSVLSIYSEVLELGDSALTLLPSSLVVDEDEYNRQVYSYITSAGFGTFKKLPIFLSKKTTRS